MHTCLLMKIDVFILPSMRGHTGSCCTDLPPRDLLVIHWYSLCGWFSKQCLLAAPVASIFLTCFNDISGPTKPAYCWLLQTFKAPIERMPLATRFSDVVLPIPLIVVRTSDSQNFPVAQWHSTQPPPFPCR